MFTLRELRERLSHPILLISWVAGCTLTTMAGPFGTSETLGWPAIYFFWPTFLTCAFVAAVTTELIFRPENINLSPIRLLMIGAVFFSVVNTGLAIALGFPFAGEPLFAHFPYVAGFLSNAVMFLSVGSAKMFFQNEQDTAAPISFLKRLKPGLGRKLLRILGQDHYVEVVTAGGSDLLLMRFADAVAELDGFDGMQVHRSHWVARNAIVGVNKSNGKMTLMLSDNSTVPVSRSFRPVVCESGYLDRLPTVSAA